MWWFGSSALVILHQREGLLSEEECILLGSSSTHTKLNLQEVVPIIIEKSTDVSCRICEVLEKHEILSDEEIRTLKGTYIVQCLVSAVHCVCITCMHTHMHAHTCTLMHACTHTCIQCML